jgi:glycosyltransferase involved in cell wall biosynthesis
MGTWFHRSIIFLTTGLNYGGAETQLYQLAIRLKARGWSTKVISMLPPEAYVKELTEAGISVLSLNMRRGIADPRAIFKLATILRYERPQILHAHMVHANLLARTSRLLVHMPVVICTAHSVDEGGKLREIAYRLTDPLCDLTTQVSQAGLARYVQVGAVPPRKIRFVPNGIELEHFNLMPGGRERLRADLGLPESFIWLAVGRFEKAKDYPVLLQAFAQVQQQQPEVRLYIVGQGTLKQNMVELADALKISQAVQFLGIRRDVANLMRAADGYVMSSAWEGLPMVLLEASASGLPIVATRVGGIPEIVIDGQTGFLVPPQNPPALAQAMLKMMALPTGVRQAMGIQGRIYTQEHYGFDKILDEWEKIYENLIQRQRV